MALLDGVLGRPSGRFDEAQHAPGADDRKKGARAAGPPPPVAPAGPVGDDEKTAPLPPARSHLGRVLDLVA